MSKGLSPSVSLYHDTRRILDNGKFPIYVRVNFRVGEQWKQRLYSTGVSLSRLEWEQMHKSNVRLSDELKKSRKDIFAKEAFANEILEDTPFIKPEIFAAVFSGKQTRSAMVKQLYREVIELMKASDQVGSADAYLHSMNALIEYAGEGVTLNVIDEDFLAGFEAWMKKPRTAVVYGKERIRKGRSVTTIGFYLRPLRAVFNIAIDRKIIPAELYPFGRKRYKIPSKRNKKLALTENDKIMFVKYRPTDPREIRALEDWKFSYYCNGMNFADMAYLKKPDNFQRDIIIYIRRKTMNTERENDPLAVSLRKEAKDILSRRSAKGFVFGIIDETMDATERKQKVHQWVKQTNKYLKRISERLDIPRVTTYTARHTAATLLYRAGANLIDIKDALGHASVTTTEEYLASLDVEKMKKMSESL